MGKTAEKAPKKVEKQERPLSWFSLEGIMTEVRRIRWPNAKELSEKSGKVLMFCVLFGIFFVACEGIVSAFLKLIGVGA